MDLALEATKEVSLLFYIRPFLFVNIRPRPCVNGLQRGFYGFYGFPTAFHVSRCFTVINAVLCVIYALPMRYPCVTRALSVRYFPVVYRYQRGFYVIPMRFCAFFYVLFALSFTLSMRSSRPQYGFSCGFLRYLRINAFFCLFRYSILSSFFAQIFVLSPIFICPNLFPFFPYLSLSRPRTRRKGYLGITTNERSNAINVNEFFCVSRPH